MKKVTFFIVLVLITVISHAQTTQYYDINVRTNPYASIKTPEVRSLEPIDFNMGTSSELNSLLRISSGTSNGTNRKTYEDPQVKHMQQLLQQKEQREQEARAYRQALNNEDAQVRGAIAKLMIETSPPQKDQSVFYAPVRKQYVYRTPDNKFFYGTVENGQVKKSWIR